MSTASLFLTAMTCVPFALGAALIWREGAVLSQPRAGYIAGSLDGRLVIAGGSYWKDDRKIRSDRTELFDPRTGNWATGPALPHPLSDAASSTLGDAVYAFGGVTDEKLRSNVLKFDREGWHVLQDCLPQPRMYTVGATLGDAIYLFGGLLAAGNLQTATTDLLRWTPKQSFEKRSSFPGHARVTAALAAAGRKLYVFGGAYQENGHVRNLNDAWMYDPAADRWEELPRLPVARRAWGSVAVNDHLILLCGGYTDTFASEVFAFDTRARTAKLLGSLPHGLADAKYIRMGSSILTAGGESGVKIRAPWTFFTELGEAAQ